MSAGQVVRVRFTRLGKREQVEVTAELLPRESVAELVCRVAHEQAKGDLRGVQLRVRITPPPTAMRSSAQYAYVDGYLPSADGQLHPKRVGHGPVWVGETRGEST